MEKTTDDGLPWGWMDGDDWIVLPKGPLVHAGLGPPPFDVTLPSGVIRHVVHQPPPSLAAYLAQAPFETDEPCRYPCAAFPNCGCEVWALSPEDAGRIEYRSWFKP